MEFLTGIRKLKDKIKFPHISFRIPSWAAGILEKIVIFTMAVALLLNITSDYLPEDKERALIGQIFANPTSVDLRLELGKFYLLAGKTIWAEDEFKQAQQLFEKEENTTTHQSSPVALWQTLKNRKENITRQIKYWEKVEKTLPHYTFAQLMLAQLYFNLGNKDKTVSLVEKVLKTQPTNKLAKDILLEFE